MTSVLADGLASQGSCRQLGKVSTDRAHTLPIGTIAQPAVILLAVGAPSTSWAVDDVIHAFCLRSALARFGTGDAGGAEQTSTDAIEYMSYDRTFRSKVREKSRSMSPIEADKEGREFEPLKWLEK